MGGMRDIFGLLYDTSLLDAKTVFFFFTSQIKFNYSLFFVKQGITFRGYSIPELSEFLPVLKFLI